MLEDVDIVPALRPKQWRLIGKSMGILGCIIIAVAVAVWMWWRASPNFEVIRSVVIWLLRIGGSAIAFGCYLFVWVRQHVYRIEY